MATSPDDKSLEQGLTFRRYEDGDDTWDSMEDLIFQEDTSYKCPTYIQKTPPCQGSCPAGEDIRGWLQIVRGIEKPAGDLSMQEYAFRRSTAANPFPSMMGRVCPAPCQDGCNRNDVDDFVGINSIEQYIGDQAIDAGLTFDDSASLSGKKVAIIGGGVAGLTAAYQLRKMGHASTVFDDHSKLGGMARYGIPGYRVPRDKMDAEIKRITDMDGVEVKLNTRIGKDVSVESLEDDYDAILWALGCKKGRGLFVDNWNDVPNAVTAVDFLEQFNKDEMKYTSSKIVCVGGGDTSIDVVSIARRIGTRSDYNELPEDSAEGRVIHGDVDTTQNVPCDSVVLTAVELIAADHEIHDAEREGIKIIKGVMPTEIITDENGRATALKLIECTMEGGIPKAVEGGEETLVEADLIVSAIGQFGDLEGIDGVGNERNAIDADNFYQVPGKEGHFVAGDIVRPHLLTTAIGQGSIAAESIDSYLKQAEMEKRPRIDKHHFDLLDKLKEFDLSPVSFDEGKEDDLRGTDTDNYAVHNFVDRSNRKVVASSELFLGHFERVNRILRSEDVPNESDVLGHFVERMNPLNDEQVVEEADRCMSCGMCFECDNCVIYCPQDAVFKVKKDKATLGRYVDTNYDKCVGCHICTDVCPTGYIEMGLI